MSSVVLARYYNFLKQLKQYNTFNDFFQIGEGNTHIDIELRQNDTIYIVIQYQQAPSIKYDFKHLPDEICDHIHNYLGEYIELTFQIKYSNTSFPFDPPIWGLYSITHNVNVLNGGLTIEDYYKYIVQNHNDQNERSWSPAISISADILTFITRVYPFEHILFPQYNI
jgi:hypothetical protein|tara:strand:- start:1625 stop:2128 length:504 start_codon:yes stop_codon:yes gene_type:complete